MDFLNFFGLGEDPFKLTPDPAYFYPSSTHNEGLLLLDYSIEQKEGFTLVTGDPGSGKTTLLNVFLEKWKPRAEMAMILTPRLSPEEFLVSISEDLGINLKDKNKNEVIKSFRDFMIEKSSEGKWVIIIVDEAQNLPDETLEELRLLSNIETYKEKLLQIFLIGQPELKTRLTGEKLRQLNQRITTRVHLKHFKPDETVEYVNHRLIKAGKRNLKINRRAGRLVHKLSDGIPRLINMLVSRALMAAYLEESHTVYPRHIIHAVKSLNHTDLQIRKRRQLIPLPIGVLLILLTGALSYIYLQGRGWYDSSPREKTQETKEVQVPMVQKEAEAPVAQYVIVNVNSANVREMPSTTSKSVGKSLRGERFEILGEAMDNENKKWYQILYKGEKRWISGAVVKIE